VGSFWDSVGIVLRWCWDRLGNVLGSFWDRFFDSFLHLLGSFWDRFGMVLGSFFDSFGIVLESFWDVLAVAIYYASNRCPKENKQRFLLNRLVFHRLLLTSTAFFRRPRNRIRSCDFLRSLDWR